MANEKEEKMHRMKLERTTPFADYGKIRIYLRQSSVNKTNIHSLTKNAIECQKLCKIHKCVYVSRKRLPLRANECLFCRNEQQKVYILAVIMVSVAS